MLHVKIFSLQEDVFQGEAVFVTLPGISGEFGVYPGHSSFVTYIQPGPVCVYLSDDNETPYLFACSSGLIEVGPKHVIVYADQVASTSIDTDYQATYRAYKGSVAERLQVVTSVEKMMYSQQTAFLQAQLAAIIRLKKKR